MPVPQNSDRVLKRFVEPPLHCLSEIVDDYVAVAVVAVVVVAAVAAGDADDVAADKLQVLPMVLLLAPSKSHASYVSAVVWLQQCYCYCCCCCCFYCFGIWALDCYVHVAAAVADRGSLDYCRSWHSARRLN